MRKLTFLSLIAASLFIAAQAPAHQGATGIVKERMDAFKASQRHLKSIIAAAKTDEFDKVEKLARQLAEWGRAMPEYFPADSAHPPSEAAPAIWQDFRASRRRQIALPGHPESWQRRARHKTKAVFLPL